MLVLATRPGGKESDNRHDRLLPPRTQRPCRRRTAHERDEFASFHSIELHPIPHKPGPGATGYRIDDDQSAGVRMILHTECRAAPKTASRFESGAPQSTDVNEHVLDASCVPLADIKPMVHMTAAPWILYHAERCRDPENVDRAVHPVTIDE